MIYPRSLMIEYTGDDSFLKWCEMLPTRGKRRIPTLCDLAGHRIEDMRVNPWLKFPLSRFVKPLVDTRNKYKKELKEIAQNFKGAGV